MVLRLPGAEPGSIAWKAIILTVGLQTLIDCTLTSYFKNFKMDPGAPRISLSLCDQSSMFVWSSFLAGVYVRQKEMNL